jgi:hypothetical protein
LLSLIPLPVQSTFFATHDQQQMAEEVEQDILDCFGNHEMNKHLIYAILELVILRLVPEMAEKTPTDLLADRGVILGGEQKQCDSP